MIADLVSHNVAITSTLAVFEAFDGDRPPVEQRFLDAVSPEAAVSYLSARSRARGGADSPGLAALKKELEFEYAFVKAGGLLIAGADPTGNGGALAGFADQRNIELLVEGGFTPVEAIRIATANGAKFLGQLDRIGTIAPGKQADLVVDQRQSRRPHRRHPQRETRLQGRRRLRPRQTLGICARTSGPAISLLSFSLRSSRLCETCL